MCLEFLVGYGMALPRILGFPGWSLYLSPAARPCSLGGFGGLDAQVGQPQLDWSSDTSVMGDEHEERAVWEGGKPRWQGDAGRIAFSSVSGEAWGIAGSPAIRYHVEINLVT